MSIAKSSRACASNCASSGTVFRLGEKVVSVGFDDDRDRVFAKLESGKNGSGQGLLYTIGRQANSDLLNLEAAGHQPPIAAAS